MMQKGWGGVFYLNGNLQLNAISNRLEPASDVL